MKTSKSNISKTVREREKVSIYKLDMKSYNNRLSNGGNIFDLR